MRLTAFCVKCTRYLYRETILHGIWCVSAYLPIFPTMMFEQLRPRAWRLLGVKIGKGVKIGYGVYLDVPLAQNLTIGNNVAISAQTLILLHKRDMARYDHMSPQHTLPMRIGAISIGDNVHIGMRAMIMPGVRIGEGSTIGAQSLVTKDIPPYSLVTGVPARVVRDLRERTE